MTRLFLLPMAICFFYHISIFSQTIPVEQLKGIQVRSIGPAGMSGRVTALDVDLKSGDIYCGTASGGLWRSSSAGIQWEPLFDKQGVSSIGSVKVNQQNPDEIWVGTGEGNPRNSQNFGRGIFKSIDGGKNWKCMGLEETRAIHRIIVHRDHPEIVYAGALGSSWGPNDDRGVFRTTDGGKTWKKILYVNNMTGCADLVVDPGNPNKLIAAMWEYGRKPWTFQSGGKGSGLYISYDGGDTWEQRTEKDGLPKGDLGRIGLAIAASSSSTVYALIEAAKDRGLYKSTDGGFNWSKAGETGDRPFYFNEIYVDPKNENRIYSIHTIVSKSEDGGKSFSPFAGWIIHPDHHAFWIHPNDPDYLIEGNDGGMNISHDRGQHWQFVRNLPLGQFYHLNVDMDIPYNIYGGLQDNGSWIGPSAVWRWTGIRNDDWQEVLFGDGFDVLPRRDNNRYGFAMSQGGDLNYYDRKTGFTQSIQPRHPDGIRLRFNWNTGLAQNPFHDCGIYYGSQFLHKSLDCGNSWEIISPDLTSNDTSKLKQDQSGGLTTDASGAENYCTIISIAPSPLDENVIWVGTDDGNLQLTRDGGKTWTNLIEKLPDCPEHPWIPQIEVSAHNAGEAFVVLNNYRQNDWKPYLYHTTDFGKKWERLADEKKVSGFCLSVVQDTETPELLFLGTDFGLYFSIDAGKNWNKWTNDYPSVPTADMKIHPRDGDLVIATFGRAIYVLDDIAPFRELARSKGKVLESNFKAFPTQDAYLAAYRSVNGARFPASEEFSGDNKPYGAQFYLWYRKPEEKKDKKDEKKDKEENKEKPDKDKDKKDAGNKVKVVILGATGDTIRWFSTEIDTGINRIGWGFDRNGVRYPSVQDPKPDDNLPGIGTALPGKYKVVFAYGDFRDSTTVNVLMDPRLDISLRDLEAKNKAMEAYMSIVKKATAGYERLKEGEKTISLVESQLVNVPDSLKQDIIKQGKALRDSISELKKKYMLPRDLTGIQDGSRTLNSALFEARGYIESSPRKPGPNAQISIDKASKDTDEIITRINALFDNNWAQYRKNVEQVKYSLFKDFPPIQSN